MSKLILSKHESIQLFIKTRYINDIYSNPFSSSILEDYYSNTEVDEDDEWTIKIKQHLYKIPLSGRLYRLFSINLIKLRCIFKSCSLNVQ